MIDAKTINEISNIIYKAFESTGNLEELEALCKFIEQSIPPKQPPQKHPRKPTV